MAKLMLVEDDNNLREIYEARLQAEGYEIVSAQDGEQALVVAKSEKPDLIISDVMMPKISGFEMLDILRNTEGLKDVKVIMLTALGQNDDQQRADKLGADRYLVKSQVTLEDIVKVAHDLLQDQPAEATAPAAAVSAPPTPAPEPVAQPVAEPPAEPAAAPAPTPTAIPVVEPPAENVAVEATTPQAEATEAAGVEAKIEDFVAGATEEAPSPTEAAAPAAAVSAPPATPTPAPEPVAQPVVAEPPAEPVAEPPTTPIPSAPAPTDDNAAADEKLVNDAAQRLADSTAGQDEDAAAGNPVVFAPAAPPAEEVASPELEAVEAPQPAANSENVTIAHKKVILPPDSTPKRDINALLAEEEAKQPSPATPTIVTGDSKPDDGKVDPHSIAL